MWLVSVHVGWHVGPGIPPLQVKHVQSQRERMCGTLAIPPFVLGVYTRQGESEREETDRDRESERQRQRERERERECVAHLKYLRLYYNWEVFTQDIIQQRDGIKSVEAPTQNQN